MDTGSLDFDFDYDAGRIRYGRGCVADLGGTLADLGCERALVVCGRTVGSTPAVIDPVREGLGDRLAGVFDRTTPQKRLGTANEGVRRLRETGADAIVAVGGGSSLDLAKAMAALEAGDRPFEVVSRETAETGGLAVPEGPLVPTVAVPTTLAGADLSVMGGLTVGPDDPGGPARGGLMDRRLMADALHYDPALFETTPTGVLTASAMNGFNKGVETLYAANRTPVSDATAMRGLGLLRRGLPDLGAGETDETTLYRSVVGTVLVQYGASRPDGSTLSVLHSYGHALSRPYDIQQGAAHAVITPHALRGIFEAVDGRRGLLAEALLEEPPEDPGAQADAVVEAVAAVRDGLGLPSRLRDTPVPREAFEEIAEAVLGDSFMAAAPPAYDPSVEDIVAVLEAAW
jgi:alcohol dehydrogenase